MKKVFLVLLAVAVLLTATAALWQFVPLFVVAWDNIPEILEYAHYQTLPLDTSLEGFRVPSSISFGGNFNPGLRICMGVQGNSASGYAGNFTFRLNTEHGAWYNFSGMYDLNDPPPYEDLPEYTVGTLTVPNGGTIWWVDSYYDPFTDTFNSLFDQDTHINYIDIIIFEDGHIVGFAVYKQAPAHDGEKYLYGILSTERVGSAYFPKSNGEYQDISPECIEAKIQQIKDNTRNDPKYYYEAEDN